MSDETKKAAGSIAGTAGEARWWLAPAVRNASLQALAAAGLYSLIAALFIWHGASLTHEISGAGSDPFDSTWFLSWWPYALTHHLDPFFTRLVWYPTGVSLLWLTSVPLLSLLTWPLTATAGPLLSYNLLIILAPVLTALSGFLLCRYLTKEFAAALLGGFLLGFSSYVTAQSTGALNLAFVPYVPLLLLVVVMRLDGRLSRPAAVALAALLLLASFLICIEIFATMFLFGGIAWVFAMLALPGRRAVLRRLVIDALITAPFVAVPLLPLLVSMLRHYGDINHPAMWPYIFAVNLLNLVFPSPLNIAGPLVASLSLHLGWVPQEVDGYLGLPLLLLLLLFFRSQAGTPRGKLLLYSFLACLILSFGPMLWVASYNSPALLPWRLFMFVPLLSSALPCRFALFTAIVAAVAAAYWLSMPGARRWRLALGGLACLILLPAPHPWRPVPRVAFFAPGHVQALLGRNPRLIILPFSAHGPSSMWQAQNRFGFTQVGGYLGWPPRPAQKDMGIIVELAQAKLLPGFAARFAAFAQAGRAQYVVAGPGTDAHLLAALAGLGWPARQDGGVMILTIPEE